MDTKALAKSKRSHTLQHNKSKKPHPNQKPSKTPSTENKQKPQKSRLPSNWDRYEDDEEDKFGVNLENPSGDNLKKPNFKDDGAVLPKSKGADFKYLLDEARSKCHQRDYFPSLEDLLAVVTHCLWLLTNQSDSIVDIVTGPPGGFYVEEMVA
ncbi:unnamed protein product [Dovyalis caffra]|uniref:Uncharacterized protein n=1 Tax=Dovyalis caffra TaxID=77055 RepID=A0AAV1QPC0_9ROSI|nr:unnamed protein product [Dovyalis caffra]